MRKSSSQRGLYIAWQAKVKGNLMRLGMSMMGLMGLMSLNLMSLIS